MRNRLPGILQDIADVAGTSAAFKIAAAKGGVRAYFPKNPAADHWLSLLAGHEQAIAIGEVLGGVSGSMHEVPMTNLSQTQRWQRMHVLADKRLSRAKIARELGCHYKTVQRVLNGHRKTVDQALKQLDLF